MINLDLLATDGFPENISLCTKDNLGRFHETWVRSIYFQRSSWFHTEGSKIMLFHNWCTHNVCTLCRWSFLLLLCLNARWFGTSNMWGLQHQNLLEWKLLTLWVTLMLFFPWIQWIVVSVFYCFLKAEVSPHLKK